MNDDVRIRYNTNSQIKFKTTLLKSSLINYNNAFMLVKWTITITEVGGDVAAGKTKEKNKQVAFKNGVPFTDSISEKNNTLVENAKDLDVVMLMYNLIEYAIILWKHQESFGSTTRVILMIT